MNNHLLLCGLIFVLVLVATATGVFYHTPGNPIAYTTVRGEPAVSQGSGLYRYDPAWLAKEGIIWDAINLFIGLPLFGLAIYLSARGSLAGRLFLGGLLFYFFYVYLLLMSGYAFNRMFLVYVAIFGLSAVAFFINLNGIDVASLPAQISGHFPRRILIGFTFIMSAMLIFLWMGRILPLMASDRFPSDMTGLITLQSQGIDLGLVVPLLLATGILLWQRSAWGYLLASVSLGYSLMMCITIPAWIVIPLIQDGKLKASGAVPFLALCLVGFLLTISFYANVRPDKPQGAVPAASLPAGRSGAGLMG